MSDKIYNVSLNDTLIGTTLLEKADAPMGVVFGIINFDTINLDYDFFKDYCTDNNIEFTFYPEDRLISTFNIPLLRVITENGIEIKGLSTYIMGLDCDGFYVNIIGVPYPFYEEQFPHHVDEYKTMLMNIREQGFK